MTLQFDSTIRYLRATDLKDPVTFTIIDSGEKNFPADMRKFVNAELRHVKILNLEFKKRNYLIDNFYELDETMRGQKNSYYEVILIQPIQYLLTNFYDQEELQTFAKITLGWAEETGAKIVVILDLDKNSYK